MSRSIGSAMGTFCMDTLSILRPTQGSPQEFAFCGFCCYRYAKWFIFQNYFHSQDHRLYMNIDHPADKPSTEDRT